MLLSRTKAAVSTPETSTQDAKPSSETSLMSYLHSRDYTGALTLLEFEKSTQKNFPLDSTLWMGFSAFHLGDYHRAMKIYEELCQPKHPHYNSNFLLYLAICEFYLGLYTESDKHAREAPASKLQNRLLFHLSHKFNDEKRLMQHHQHLQDVVEDQLTLASIHYLRGHYQEAIDVYKRLLADHPSFLALNVYMALCYYKLDYYDVSQELLHLYTQKYPDSIIATNVKACNQYKLYNPKAAESTLLELGMTFSSTFANDIVKLNLAIFTSTPACLSVFEPLVDVVPEARLNLALYHLKNDDIQPAYELMKDVEPSSPAEYILKAIVNAVLGQVQESRDHIKTAQQYFQLVGSSASECDTIAGRQCMASCFFLLRNFEDVLVYLNSIKTYFFNDDSFNINYAQVKVGLGFYTEAEETLLSIQSEKIKTSLTCA
ncbi:Intraflagellar transport protein 56 [Coelomomyces lativittatus]|nr:Intraflagellar transport protein 56 [Coelomomyces lativittatus]